MAKKCFVEDDNRECDFGMGVLKEDIPGISSWFDIGKYKFISWHLSEYAKYTLTLGKPKPAFNVQLHQGTALYPSLMPVLSCLCLCMTHFLKCTFYHSFPVTHCLMLFERGNAVGRS